MTIRITAILCLLIAALYSPHEIFASAASSAAATNSIEYITTKTLNKTRQTPSVTAEYPYINAKIRNAFVLNEGIQNIMNMVENDAKENKALSVTFTYEIKTGGEDGRYVSILIKSTTLSASSLDRVDTLVIDTSTMKQVHLTDIMGPNGISLANTVVYHTIDKNPSQYLSTFSGINADQDFYVENNTIKLTFDQYEIAPGINGVQEVEIILGNIDNFTLTSSQYYAQSPYNVRMVPLRDVCEHYGYSVNWIAASSTITISDGGRKALTSIRINENRYTKDDILTQTLEAAPEMKSGVTYVPISFFESILGIDYSVSSESDIQKAGDITFSMYLLD